MTYSALQLAEAFLQTGEYTDALDALNAHLTDQPDDEYARRLRAALLLRLADGTKHDYLQQAEADLAQLPVLTPQDWQTRASVAEQLGNAEQALKYLEDAYAAAPDDRLLERLVLFYQRQEQWEEALNYLQGQPRTWRWLRWQGQLLSHSQQYSQAIGAYSAAQRLLEEREDFEFNRLIQSIHREVVLGHAHAARHAQQYEVAETLYKRVQKHSPQEPSVTFNMGILRALQGDLPKAVELCREALAKEQNDILKAEMLRELDSPEFGALKQAVLA